MVDTQKHKIWPTKIGFDHDLHLSQQCFHQANVSVFLLVLISFTVCNMNRTELYLVNENGLEKIM